MAALTDADRDRLREICEVDWVSATLARDWDANMALVSEDLVYMPPDHPVLRGKQEWVEWIQSFPNLTSMAQQVNGVFGDTVVAGVRGSVQGTFEGDGQEISFVGKFLGTAAKEGDRWLFNSLCFNFDGPPAPSV